MRFELWMLVESITHFSELVYKEWESEVSSYLVILWSKTVADYQERNKYY